MYSKIFLRPFSTTSSLRTGWQAMKTGIRRTVKVIIYGTVGIITLKVIGGVIETAKMYDIPASTLVYWNLNQYPIVEKQDPRKNWIEVAKKAAATGGFQRTLSLPHILQTIEFMRDDDRVQGLIVDFSSVNAQLPGTLGFAQAQEIRDALLDLRKTKQEKFPGNFSMIAFTDTFDSQVLYYLASAFDKINMEPLGTLSLTGFSNIQMFYKNLLDRLGLQFRSFSVGQYKSFTSQFTESSMPKAQKENLKNIYENLSDQMVSQILASRNTLMLLKYQTLANANEEIKRTMDKSPLSTQECLDAGLIDGTIYKRIFFTFDDVAVHPPFIRSNQIPFHVYSDAILMEKKASGVKAQTKVGHVHLLGGIQRGQGHFGSTTITKSLLKAASVCDAIVLRIDSGGGDAIASDTIWETVHHIQTHLQVPVIASFGNVAASGGYLAAAACEKIFASPGTITGSIGVAALRPHITEKLLDHFGITITPVLQTLGQERNSPYHDLDPEGTQIWKSRSQAVYQTFVERVAQGRKMSYDQVHQLGQGRIWTGSQALEKGLVDEMGGTLKAVRAAGFLGFPKTEEAREGKAFDENRIGIMAFPLTKSWSQMFFSMKSLDDLELLIHDVVDHFVVNAMGQIMGRAWMDLESKTLKGDLETDYSIHLL